MDYLKGERLPVTFVVKLGDKEYRAMFDAHIDSKEDFSIETPTYPIEKDFDTTISTLNHQTQLMMNLFLTPYPVTWSSLFGRSIETVKDTLIRMYWQHCPITVETQDETYEDMAIKSMTFKRNSDTGDAYDVAVTLMHVKPTAGRLAQYAMGKQLKRDEEAQARIANKENGSIFNTGKLEVEEKMDWAQNVPWYLMGVMP